MVFSHRNTTANLYKLYINNTLFHNCALKFIFSSNKLHLYTLQYRHTHVRKKLKYKLEIGERKKKERKGRKKRKNWFAITKFH